MVRLLDKLKNKPANERAKMKGQEIARLAQKKAHNRQGGLRIEITDIEAIEKGVEVYARAWKDGTQIGFGKDGTVDIERFRIFNPPILVPDPQGDIVREASIKDPVSGEVTVLKRILREDPQEALLQVIDHNLTVMKNIHGAERIVKGRRGNTTSTFYSSAGANSPMDSFQYGNKGSWTGVRDATTASGGSDTRINEQLCGLDIVGGSNYYMRRGIFLFNTSVIDADDITSATLSFYFTLVRDYTTGDTGVMDIVSSNPASNSAYTSSDYNKANFGTTVFGSIASGSVTTSQYNDLVFNGDGISAIAKTGISKFGSRLHADTVDVEPSGSPVNNNLINFVGYFADQTGTTSDPKLVVEHGPSVSAPTVTTQLASSVTDTSASGNGNITDTGGENADERGFVYGTSSQSDPGDTAPGSSLYDSSLTGSGSFGTGAFTGSLTSLSPVTVYYVRAYAHNSGGYAYGDEVAFKTFSSDVFLASGQVTLSGNPVAGATIRAIKQSDNSILATQTSDANGAYTFEGLDQNETYHFAVEYEASSIKYNALSKWGVSPVELSTYDISALSFSQEVQPKDNANDTVGQRSSFVFNNDGSKLYILTSGGVIYEFTLSTPFDVSTLSIAQNQISPDDIGSQDIGWNIDGTKFYELVLFDNKIIELSASTAFDITSLTFTWTKTLTGSRGSGFAWNSDGSKLFVTDSTDDKIREYTLSTPFDIQTLILSQTINTQAPDTYGISFNDDGSKLYEVSTDSYLIYESDLSTPFDISTATFSQSIAVPTNESDRLYIGWNNDGSKFYLIIPQWFDAQFVEHPTLLKEYVIT